MITRSFVFLCFFFFNDTATTEIYTLSLHDALPILGDEALIRPSARSQRRRPADEAFLERTDRKSTRLNSSHGYISYAVFCLKKKTRNNGQHTVVDSRVDLRERG